MKTPRVRAVWIALPLFLIAYSPQRAGAGPEPSAGTVEGNKAIVRRIFESVWNEAKFDGLEEIWAAEVPFHFQGRRLVMSPERLRRIVQDWRKAFPDFRFSIGDLIGEGDRVAIRVRFTAAHTGAPWSPFGVPPSGRKIEVSEMMFFRLAGGKVVEAWEDYDEITMRRQLGATQIPTGGGAATNRPAIHALAREFDRALTAGDERGFIQLLADGVMWMVPNRPALTGKDAVRERIRGRLAVSKLDLVTTIEETQVAGAWAYVRGTYRMRITAKDTGKSENETGKVINILERQPDGAWRITRHIWNADHPDE